LQRFGFATKRRVRCRNLSTAPARIHFGGSALLGWKIAIYGKPTIPVNIHKKEVNLSAGCFSTKLFLRKGQLKNFPKAGAIIQ